MPKAQQHFVLLDAMRGVAALAVMWGHLGDAWSDPGGQDYILAVDFFFVLSGFVIAHAYQQKLATNLSVLAFYRTRVIRLYPLLMFGAFVGGMSLLIIHAGEPAWSPGRIAATTLLAALALPSFLLPTNAAFPANGPAWSLFFELVANFAYAPVARLLTRNRLVVLTIVGAMMLSIDTLHRGTIESGWSRDQLYGGFIRVFFGFTCGLTLYHVRPLWRISQRWGIALLLLLAAILLSPITHYGAGQLGLVVVVMPAIVWLGSAIEVAGVLEVWGSTLGAMSYPVYILHKPALEMSTRVLGRLAPGVDWHVWAVMQIGLFAALAWTGLRFLDEPVRAWLARRLKHPGSSSNVEWQANTAPASVKPGSSPEATLD